MEFIGEKEIRLDRELSELDLFVLKFIRILEKHTKYAIISGYVAILMGRTRTTEDIDIFIQRLSKEKFCKLYQELLEKGYWSVNVDSAEELYSMLNEDNLGIRIAEKGKVVPNIEIKFIKDKLDELSLKEKIKVITEKGELMISDIPLQVAYKKFVLKSQKDLEDARHLQELFGIQEEKIRKYKLLLKEYGRI